MTENTNTKCGCIKGSVGVVPIQFAGSVGIVDTQITGVAGIICKPSTKVYIIVDTPDILLSIDGESASFNVTANTSWYINNGGKIKWEEGEGYITIVYDGKGNSTASVTSDINVGIDRAQSVVLEATNKAASATVTIEQEGMREIFKPANGEFVIANGGTFNVLKKKHK